MKILYLHLSGLGDYIMARPALQYIKKQNPGSTLTITCTEKAINDLLIEDDFIDDAIFLTSYIIFFKEIREYKPDITYTSASDVSWTYKLPILALLSGAKMRIGAKQENLSFLYSKCINIDKELTVERECQLVGLVESQTIKELYLKDTQHKNKKIKKIAIINTLTGLSRQGDRKLSNQTLADIVNYLNSRMNYQISIYLIGLSIDIENYKEALDNIKNKENIYNLASKTTIKGYIELLEDIDLVISIDTGTMHLADMYNVKVLPIFGNTNFKRNVAYLNRANLVQLNCTQLPEYCFGNEVYEKIINKIEEII